MKEKIKKNSFIQGTMIATISMILIKIIGAVYVIPFYQIIGGEKGGALYGYAYNIYGLFLNIATAGIPVAMSMIISEYLTLQMYDAKEKSKKIATKMVGILAIVSFIIVFFGAPLLAKFLISDVEGGYGIQDVATVIRAVSFCLLIIPFLSVMRGYFQGHKFITPSSVSQVLEQIVRIAVVLAGSYVVINIMHLGTVEGVSVALIGAFVGGLIAYLYLYAKMKKNKDAFPTAEKKDNVATKEIIKKILSYSLPIIIVAIIDNIYTLVDIRFIVKGLSMVGFSGEDAKTISGIIATGAPKICTIIIAISSALTTNIIPHITSSYVKEDMEGVKNRVNQAMSAMLIISVPLTVILFFLSKEAYTIFYGASEYGDLILKASAMSHLIFGVWSVLNSALQSMKKFKVIYFNSCLGLAINAILDIPLILLFSKMEIPAYIATVVSTFIGYLVSNIIVLIYLKKKMQFDYQRTVSLLTKLLLPSVVIAGFLFVSKQLITFEYTRLNSIISGILNGGIASVLYLIIVYYNKGLEDALGKDFIGGIMRKIKRQ